MIGLPEALRNHHRPVAKLCPALMPGHMLAAVRAFLCYAICVTGRGSGLDARANRRGETHPVSICPERR